MTDNDIIKALECCTEDVANCNNFPYERHCCMHENNMLMDALDLINRQKAEIERLEKQITEMLISETCELHIPMEIAYRVRTAHPIFKAIKSEAVKEFAYRLKEEPIHMGLPILGLQTRSEIEDYFNDIMSQIGYSIDKLAKEMTEEHYETQ